MNPYAKWVAIVVAFAGVCEALRRIGKFLSEILRTLRAIHRYVIIHLGEHDLMCEDWCIRHRRTRHNMQTMAYTLSVAEEEIATNGKAAGI